MRTPKFEGRFHFGGVPMFLINARNPFELVIERKLNDVRLNAKALQASRE